jgi:hypothetical protein
LRNGQNPRPKGDKNLAHNDKAKVGVRMTEFYQQPRSKGKEHQSSK